MYQGESVWKVVVMIRKNRKKRARRKRALLFVLVFLLLAAILVLIGVTGFRLKKVQVSGNELYSDQQIKDSVLNDEYSWNTLYVVLKYRLFQTRKIPFIDEMEIDLVSPDTIRIRVYEKAMIGYIAVNDRNVYFDKDGFVVEISKRQMKHVPKVEGIECRKVIVYEKLNLKDEDMLSFLLTFSQQLMKYELVPETIVFQENGMTADFGGVKAEIGDSGYLVEKVMRLDAVISQLKGKKGTLHLENWTPLTTDIIFEPD